MTNRKAYLHGFALAARVVRVFNREADKGLLLRCARWTLLHRPDDDGARGYADGILAAFGC
jgi:hypothetical protein